MIQMDVALGNFMTSLRCQAANRKISNFKAIERGNLVVPVDVIPPSTNAPPLSRKRGFPTKMVQQNAEAGSSSQQPSMLNPLLQMVLGVQIAITPKDESVLATVPTKNLISEWIELQSRTLVVGKILG